MPLGAWRSGWGLGVGALAAACTTAAAPGAHAAQVLEKVVMVSRHGVRSPTQSNAALQASTGRAWPVWPVAPGELTEHGAQNLSAMGRFLRGVYTAEGVLPAQGCPAAGAVQVWADGADHRTRQSGDILAEQFAPGCGVVSRHGADGQPDAMFDAIDTGVCRLDPDAAMAAVRARIADADGVVGPAASAIAKTRNLLGADACAQTAAACMTGASTLVQGKSGPKVDGPLATAAGIGENLLLEYTQGMAADQVGWGGAGTPQGVAAMMPAHERTSDLLRVTPYIAGRRGWVMAHAILDLLQDRAPSDPHTPPLGADAKVVMIAGHDTNLSNMAGVFGLTWTLPGQPDGTAPDTTLAFERWRDTRSGVRTVRAVLYSQSLAQLREGQSLDRDHPAGVTPASFQGCAGHPGGCRVEALARTVATRLPTDCLH